MIFEIVNSLFIFLIFICTAGTIQALLTKKSQHLELCLIKWISVIQGFWFHSCLSQDNYKWIVWNFIIPAVVVINPSDIVLRGQKFIDLVPLEELQTQLQEYVRKKYFIHVLSLYKFLLIKVIPSDELLAREDYAPVQESLLDISKIIENPLNQTNRSILASDIGNPTNRSIIPSSLKQGPQSYLSPLQSREKSPAEVLPQMNTVLSPINATPIRQATPIKQVPQLISPPAGSFKKQFQNKTVPVQGISTPLDRSRSLANMMSMLEELIDVNDMPQEESTQSTQNPIQRSQTQQFYSQQVQERNMSNKKETNDTQEKAPLTEKIDNIIKKPEQRPPRPQYQLNRPPIPMDSTVEDLFAKMRHSQMRLANLKQKQQK